MRTDSGAMYRRGRHAQAAVLVGGLGWAVALPHVADSATSRFLGYHVLVLACVLIALVATMRMPRERRLPWALLTTGLALQFIADLLWSWYAWHGQSPSPSWADLAMLAAYIPLGACAALLARPQTTVRDRFVWLDAAILTIVVGAAIWIVLIYPYAGDPAVGAVQQAQMFAYPTADVFVFGFALRILLEVRRQTRAAVIFAGGIMCKLVGDAWYAWLSLDGASIGPGGVVDSCWLISYVLLAAAALDRSAARRAEREPDDVMGRGRLAIVLMALLAPTALVAWDLHRTSIAWEQRMTTGLGLVVSGVVCVLVLARLWSLLRRVRALDSHNSTERLSAVVHHSSDAILLVTADGVITYASTSVAQWGYDPTTSVGSRLQDWLPTEERSRLDEQLRRVSASPSGAVTELYGRILDSGYGQPNPDNQGQQRFVEGTLRNLLPHASLRAIVVTLRDVTERRELEDQLRRRAFQDELTGLANRELFADRLTHALKRSSRRAEIGVAVLFVDLDDFKSVNDGLGHGAGDELLRHVADRIRLCVRPGDTTARLGGDEFAILLEDLATLDQAAAVAQRILDVLALPVRVLTSDVTVPASIGVAPRTPGCSAESLLRDADIAMYGAKANGKRRIEVVDDSLRSAASRRLQLRCDLPSGLHSGGFRVVYQPVHRIDDHRAVGFEALLRWQHPEHGAISPVEFIPAAEASGFIVELGRWVLSQACSRAAEWNVLSPDPLVMNVNVSGVQLMHPGFPGVVSDLLRGTGLPPGLLTLELTESVLVDERVGQVLTELRELGVGIAIDDFGTGYSSLAYMHNFPITTIKIDRQFIERLDNAEDPTLVRSVLQIAEAMGLEAVAEGVETRAQLDVLQALGCPLAQGYFFGRPAEAESLLSVVAGHRPLSAEGTDESSAQAAMMWAGPNG